MLTLFHIFCGSHCFHVLFVVQRSQLLVISGALDTQKSSAAYFLFCLHERKQRFLFGNH
jgi:hypothetical protein